jgi:uncharacterized membrane protein
MKKLFAALLLVVGLASLSGCHLTSVDLAVSSHGHHGHRSSYHGHGHGHYYGHRHYSRPHYRSHTYYRGGYGHCR